MNGDAIVTWTFENWITVGLMSLLAFWVFHFVSGKVKKGAA